MARNLGMLSFKAVKVQMVVVCFSFFLQEGEETLASQKLLNVLSHFVKTVAVDCYW